MLRNASVVCNPMSLYVYVNRKDKFECAMSAVQTLQSTRFVQQDQVRDMNAVYEMGQDRIIFLSGASSGSDLCAVRQPHALRSNTIPI